MFHGSIVALVTPMSYGGEIDLERLRTLINKHIEQGTDAIVVMGSTGEAATISESERRQVIQVALETAAKRIPIIAGTGTHSTAETIKRTRDATVLGVDACLIVTPYYNRPTQEGLYQHYKTIAEAVHIPIIMYNVPSRTGCDLLPETVQRLCDTPNIVGLKEATEYNWFTMEMGVMVDNQKINILPLIVNLIQKYPLDFTENALKELTDEHIILTLENEQQIRIPTVRIKGILATLTELYDTQSIQNGGLSLYRSRISQVTELNRVMEIEKMKWLGGEALIELSKKIANFDGIVPVKLPKTFKGKLRDYQQKGVDWLNFLREYQLGGILADDMGLGKTVQTLAHIMIEKASGRLNKPCLIIAPTSLMGNWQSEAAQFAPSLNVMISQGQSRKNLLTELPSADLILTTYPLIVRDKDILLEHEYYMIILDEAQFIKNANTKAYLILQKFKSKHRLCLTGTPMENHLGELWSLFNFLSPGLLGTSKQFTQLFRTPIEKQGNIERRRSLNQRIKPYMLRRTKSEVVQELPTKTEIIHHIVLEEEQRDLYESIRLAMETKVQKAVEAKGFAQSQIIILDALLKLRQACADPRLLKLEQAKKVKTSAKLSFLMSMLSELVEEGRKILLFSSFTSMLSLIEDELKAQAISYVKLTGSTTDRATPVKSFQAGEASVFLISLKAGGTGLNLTTADTVIHYDPWWNPAAEAQATDRAHRIGQKKPVFVYKLVTTGTVEEKILLMQQNKRALMESLFEESSTTKTRITKEDLNFLFQPIESVEETS